MHRRWLFVAAWLVGVGACAAGGEYVPTDRQGGGVDRGETNGRTLDLVSNRPEGDDWEVRIRGSIAAIEIDAERGYLADVGRTMRLRCLEMGVFLRPLGNVLYAMPPFCTSNESLARIAGAMTRAVAVANPGRGAV